MAPTKPDEQAGPAKLGTTRKGRRNAAGVLYQQSPDKVGKVVRQRDLARVARYDPRLAKKNPPPKTFHEDFKFRPIEYEDGDVNNPLKGNRLAPVEDEEEYEDDDEAVEDEEYEEAEVVAAGLASARKPKRPQYAKRPAEEKGKYFLNENGVMIRVDPDAPWKPTSYNDMATAGKKYPERDPGITDRNGRFIGRHLVNWHRPRMMEKLLLCIQYECHRDGLLIPWDKIVHRLNPGSSGPSAVQMLCKLREVLITEGHFIPPSLGKRAMMIDPKIRGYTRDKEKPEPWAARTVSWMEEIDHPKESLTDNGVIRGSGKYRLANPDDVNEINERREKIEGPLAAPAYPLPGMPNGPPAESNSPQNSTKRSTLLKLRVRNKVLDDEDFEQNDPDENDPDEDYDPEVPKRTRRRAAVRARPRRSSIFDEVDNDSDDVPHPASGRHRSTAVKTPAPMSQSSSRKPSTTPSKSFGHGGKLSYEGPEEHGTIAQFSKAIKDGIDPTMNGTRYQTRGTSAENSIDISDDAEPAVASTTPKTPANVDHSLTNAANGTQVTGAPGTGGVSRLQLGSPSLFNTPNRLYPFDMPISAHLAENMAAVGVDANFRPIAGFDDPTSFSSPFDPLSHPVFGGSGQGFGNQAAHSFIPPGQSNGFGNGFTNQNHGMSMFAQPELKSESPSANSFSDNTGNFSQTTAGFTQGSNSFSQSNNSFSQGNDRSAPATGGMAQGNGGFPQVNNGSFQQTPFNSSGFHGHDNQTYGFSGYGQDHASDFTHQSHFDDAVDAEKHEPSSPDSHGSPSEYREY